MIESKKTKICQVCGKTYKSRKKTSKFCSKKCTYIGRVKRKKIRIKRQCLNCEKIFNGLPSEVKRDRAIFCNKKCYLIWRKKQRTIQCKYCEKNFERHNAQREFCSYNCWLKWNRETRIKRLEGNKYQTKRGYVNIINENGKSIPEHKLVWEKHNGKLLKKWIIHHLNGIKNDNRIENLAAMPRKFHSSTLIIKPYKTRIKELEYQLNKKLK